MKKVLKEFRDFAVRGAVVDMAAGVIIGAALGKIVSSLVSDVLMPPISILTNGVDLSNLFFTVGPGSYATIEAAKTAGASTVNYGVFIQSVIDFLIVAFCVFLMVKFVNSARKKETAAPPPVSSEVRLLEEIRDLLKKP